MTLTANLGALATAPPSFTMATTETLPLGFDTTLLLAEGQSPLSATCVLKDVGFGTINTLADSPTISGNIITQIVRGTELSANHTYALSVTFTATTNTTWTMVLTISVPQ